VPQNTSIFKPTDFHDVHAAARRNRLCGSQFVFAGYSGVRSPIAGSTFGCVPHAEPSGWGRSPFTDSGTLRQQFCSTMWERICGKSRNCSATKISAPPCATPTSAMSRHGGGGGSAKLWSRAKKRKCLPLPHRRARQKKDKKRQQTDLSTLSSPSVHTPM
jgi:hypothetical protein